MEIKFPIVWPNVGQKITTKYIILFQYTLMHVMSKISLHENYHSNPIAFHMFVATNWWLKP